MLEEEGLSSGPLSIHICKRFLILLARKTKYNPGMVVLTCNSSTQKAERGGL
jgi:hypothetical protein